MAESAVQGFPPKATSGEDEVLVLLPPSQAASIPPAGLSRSRSGLILCVSICMAAAVALTFAALLTCTAPSNAGKISSSSSSGFVRPLKVLNKPLVILISSDGFRWGYQWKVATPNMDRLRNNGTEAFPGMIPVYPTVTFPNHYSIVTGLYPAWHGIIANSFKDPDPSSKERFYMGNLNPKWWLGEPIWETVVKNGLQAAVYFWPGSQVVKGPWSCKPELCPSYNGSVPFQTRVDAVLGYVDLPEAERPSFIAVYFEEPDEQGHKFGPDSPQITEAIKTVDANVGRLLDGLQKRGILEDVSIIMVSDHGMVGTCDKKLIYLEDFKPWFDIPSAWVTSTSPVLAITPLGSISAEELVKKMNEALSSGKIKNGEYLKVYLKQELPQRLHYSSSDRIEPIIGMVAESYKVEMSRTGKQECGGAHGYDNAYASMRSIFIGHGPQFARGRKVDSFVNVEIYNTIASILGIQPAPNNGTHGFVDTLLLPKS